MSDADVRDSSHVHWLLLGSLSSKSSGRRFILDAESFAETFAEARLAAKLDIGPSLGAGGAHEVEVSFAKLRQYSIKHVLASIPLLGKLRELADSLGKPSSKRPSDEATIARVVNLIGDGDLSAELRKVFAGEDEQPEPEPTPEAPADAAADGSDNTSLVDELLESHETKQADAKKAVDSFIALMRGKRSAAKGSKPTPANRRARELIETAIYGSVNAILNHPAVTGPESLWRGLNLVVKHAPRKAGMLVEIVDVAPEGIEDAIRACLDDEPMNRPDTYFCFDRIEDPNQMQAIASVAEDMHAPVVMGVGPRFFGVEDAEDIIPHMRAAESGASVLPEDYAQLRADEVSRWLSLTVNDVVVAAEGAGDARRSVLGSSVFALAAMIAASFHHTGGFARILGKEGSLKAPGLREVQKGREAGSTVPTAAFLSIRAQAELAENGFIGLGSGRNSDMVALSEVRTVRASKDAVILPAQILTGRLVRFGLWVAEQVPAGSTKDEVVQLFTEAAKVFLFPGLSAGAELHAGVVDEGQGPAIRLVANVSPHLAGTPFEVGFDLPLSVAVAD